jgi:hypothetical protein
MFFSIILHKLQTKSWTKLEEITIRILKIKWIYNLNKMIDINNKKS